MIPEMMKRISELENVTHFQAERIQALTDNITELRGQLQVPQAACEASVNQATRMNQVSRGSNF